MSFKNFIAKSVKVRPKYEEELLVVYLPWKEQYNILISDEIPSFIHDIYSSCNGTDPEEQNTENYHFIPDFRLMKVQELMKLHCELVKDHSITKDLVPFLADKDNNYICYRNNKTKEDIVYFSNGKITKMYDSLDSFWKTISKGYEDKIYGLDFKKTLSADDSKVKEIAKELNPNSDYWN